MNLRYFGFILLVSIFFTSCSLYNALFRKVPGIYMTEEEELGGRLELDKNGEFWYYWETTPDTFGTSHGTWDKKFDKVILTSADSVDPNQNETCNVLREIYNDSISSKTGQIVNTKFFPIYGAAWIIKRNDQVLSSGLTDRDGRFSASYRANDSILVSARGFSLAKYQVGAGGINDIKIQMLKGEGNQYVKFDDVVVKIKKRRLELYEGGDPSFMGQVFYKYFNERQRLWQ